jgi:hypothetical protein
MVRCLAGPEEKQRCALCLQFFNGAEFLKVMAHQFVHHLYLHKLARVEHDLPRRAVMWYYIVVVGRVVV